MTELENGDEVEIIRSDAQVPPAAWEGLAVTGKARAAIRRATRAAVRRQYAGLGREIVERLLGQNDRKSRRQAKWPRRSPRLGHKNLEDALAAVGRGELSGADMLQGHGTRASRMPTPRIAEESHHPKGRGRRRPVDPGARRQPQCGAPAFRPIPARCPASALSASSRRARASPSIRSSPRRSNNLTAEPERWIDLAWDAIR